MNVSQIRAAYMAGLESGLGLAEAAKRANSLAAGASAAARAAAADELPTVDEIKAMKVADLRRFLAAEAVDFPDGASKAGLQAIALGVLEAEAGADGAGGDTGEDDTGADESPAGEDAGEDDPE